MDRFESMAMFVAVAEAGGFSAASRKLAKPLATVSRKVSELEEQLGIALLARSTRHVTLTDSGRQYYEACRRILNDVAEAEREAAGEQSAARGELIVTAPIVFGRLHLVPVATAFMAVHPEISLRLVLVDRVVNLLEEQADIALRIGDLKDSDMKTVRVGETTRVVCASGSYLAARGAPQELEELAPHDCINVTAIPPAQGWLLQVKGKEVAVPVTARLAVTTAEAGIEAALHDCGLVQVHCYQVSDRVREGALKTVLRQHEPRHAPISLVYNRGRHMPEKLRAFRDYVAPRLRKRLERRGWDC